MAGADVKGAKVAKGAVNVILSQHTNSSTRKITKKLQASSGHTWMADTYAGLCEGTYHRQQSTYLDACAAAVLGDPCACTVMQPQFLVHDAAGSINTTFAVGPMQASAQVLWVCFAQELQSSIKVGVSISFEQSMRFRSLQTSHLRMDWEQANDTVSDEIQNIRM